MQLEIVGIPVGLGLAKDNYLYTQSLYLLYVGLQTPNIWLKFRFQKVTWYTSTYSKYKFISTKRIST